MQAPQSATATMHFFEAGTFRVLDVASHSERLNVRDFLDNRSGRRYTSVVTVLNAARVPALRSHAERVNAPPGAVLGVLAALREALRSAGNAEMFAVLVSGESDCPRIDALAFNIAPRLSPTRPPSVAVDVGGTPRDVRRGSAARGARRGSP